MRALEELVLSQPYEYGPFRGEIYSESRSGYPIFQACTTVSLIPRLTIKENYDRLQELLALPAEELAQQVAEAEDKCLFAMGLYANLLCNLPDVLEYALCLLARDLPKVEHTGNQWVEPSKTQGHISNAVYRLSYSVRATARRSESSRGRYIFDWRLCTNARFSPRTYVDGVPKEYRNGTLHSHRRYLATEEAVRDFLIKLKQAYSVYFTETFPPIPPSCADFFLVGGVLPPGYRFLGEDEPAFEPGPL